MKGMERQALKTAAAIASVGATLDTIGSRKQSRQMGMTSRDLRTVGVEAENAGKRARGAEQGFRKMDNQVERVGGTAERAAKKLGSLMVLMKPILWTGIGAAIGDSVDTSAKSALAPSALGDTGLLANQGFRMIRQTASALTNLLGIVRNFGVAAMPFTNWLTSSVVLWSRHRLAISQFNRD